MQRLPWGLQSVGLFFFYDTYGIRAESKVMLAASVVHNNCSALVEHDELTTD